MQRAEVLRLRPRLFLGNPAGFTAYRFRDYAGNAANHVFSSTIWSPSVPYPGAREYYDMYNKKHQSPTDYHGAQAYAAMYVIADALKRTKSLTPKGMRDALAETDTMTIFGPVKFVSYDKKTQQNALPTYLVQWINGKLETVWPPDVASAKYVYPIPAD
jgi:branched-chain amino acid transport system substrate-binding protein